MSGLSNNLFLVYDQVAWRLINCIYIIGSMQYAISIYLSVCVCGLVNPTLWGQNVPTRMAISEILVRVGTFFGPHEETSL